MPNHEFENDEMMSCEGKVRTAKEAIREILKLWGKDGSLSKGTNNGSVSNINMIICSLSSSRDRIQFVEAFFEVFEAYADTGRMPVILPVEEAGVELRSVKIINN